MVHEGLKVNYGDYGYVTPNLWNNQYPVTGVNISHKNRNHSETDPPWKFQKFSKYLKRISKRRITVRSCN